MSPERCLSDAVDVLLEIDRMKEESALSEFTLTKTLSNPFDFTSVEQIPEDSDLLSFLYTDTLPWFKSLLSFGTSVISGIRGCGKSMVLKNMRMKTKLMSDDHRLHIHEEPFFGFYLHSNHTLVLPFEGKNIEPTSLNMDMILHYFNLSYTLEIIDSLRLYERFIERQFSEFSIKALYDYVINFFEKEPILLDGMNILDHLKTLIERETKLVQQYMIRGERVTTFSGVDYLKNICTVLQENLPIFRHKTIYFLLDDYSTGRYVSEHVQKSLNRVISIRDDKFCFKITTERFGFIPIDQNDCKLTQDREYSYYDLSLSFMIYKEKKDEIAFMRTLLNRRLERTGIDKDVKDLFGTYVPPDKDFGRSLGNEETRKETLFAGFNMLVNLCSGDIGTLLELCRAIYEETESKEHIPFYDTERIPFELQDQVITQFSRQRFAMIKQLQNNGDQLYAVTNAMARISLLYLTRFGPVRDTRTGKDRYQEILRLNISGSKTLILEARAIFEGLIQNGIFTEAGKKYLWGDKIENIKLILRKIYAPAFKISYRDRQELKMSADDFESFLLNPDYYLNEGTGFLKSLSGGSKRETSSGQTLLDDHFEITDGEVPEY